MQTLSLGLVETLGYVAAIEAADVGSKAACVRLLGYERGLAGLVTVKFVGDVAAVRAAVTAGAAAAEKIGKVAAVHVIARPDWQLRVIPGDGVTSPEIPSGLEAVPDRLLRDVAGTSEQNVAKNALGANVAETELAHEEPQAEMIDGRNLSELPDGVRPDEKAVTTSTQNTLQKDRSPSSAIAQKGRRKEKVRKGRGKTKS